jgi:chromatin structure-remodeling complex subunit RSC9
MENFFRPTSREADRLRNGDDGTDDSEDDGETKRTPKEDGMDVDEPGSTGGRHTRGERALRLVCVSNSTD